LAIAPPGLCAHHPVPRDATAGRAALALRLRKLLDRKEGGQQDAVAERPPLDEDARLVAVGDQLPLPLRRITRAAHAHALADQRVVFFSAEMTKEELAKRACDAGRTNSEELRIAADLARVKIFSRDGRELWSLE
jgi:hypothetical protein